MMRGRHNLHAAVDHVRYIERDGVEKDGGKGIVYSSEDNINVKAFVERVDGDPHQFRFIVSPEDAGELDLKDFVKRLVAHMEDDLGRKLDWIATNHFNTDNPHAHVVIRGRDRDGKFLFIDNEYISRGIRWRAQELATLELGPRNQMEIDRQLSRDVGLERFTVIDREIANLKVGPTIDFASLKDNEKKRIRRMHFLARLEVLERFELASRESPSTWRLTDGWEAKLRVMGERGDVIKKCTMLSKAIRPDTVC